MLVDTHPVFPQTRVDVTVSGSIFSGDGLLYNHTTLPSALAEDNYMDYKVAATFAIFTVVKEVGAEKLYLGRGLVHDDTQRTQDAPIGNYGQQHLGWSDGVSNPVHNERVLLGSLDRRHKRGGYGCAYVQDTKNKRGGR